MIENRKACAVDDRELVPLDTVMDAGLLKLKSK